ncbi:hypothetical protein ABIF83_007193 [Bradyrhizobium ottawaense]
MGNVMRGSRPAHPSNDLDCIENVAHGRIARAMNLHALAERFGAHQPVNDIRQPKKGMADSCASMLVGQIRVQHGGCARHRHAVHEQFEKIWPHMRRAIVLAARDQRFTEKFRPSQRVENRQRADAPGVEFALPVEAGQRLQHGERGVRVLIGGDAVSIEDFHRAFRRRCLAGERIGDPANAARSASADAFSRSRPTGAPV